MKKTWGIYFIFLFYMELIFHITCFRGIDLLKLLLLFCFSLIFATIFTFVSSLSKNEKINSIIIKIICPTLFFIFCAELIYFKIYDSFFSMNGLFFIGAVKDGYDKVFVTIKQNLLSILLLIVPIIILFLKLPKKVPRLNKVDSLVFSIVLVLAVSYSYFSCLYINREENYSLYQLLFKTNMPTLNVKNFGLLTSASISLERKVFGFKNKMEKKEDILTNQKTSLADDLDIKYNEENIPFKTLIKSESNDVIKNIHTYFSKETPTEKNKFTGMFKDKNVIFIIAESFDEIAIDKDLTPTLYQIKKDGIQFNNYFAPKYPASTADGEYMLEWATLPIIGENYSLIDMVYNENPYLLPRILKKKGYHTYAYHNYTGAYNRRKKYFSTLDFDGMRYCNDGITMQCDHFHGSDVDMMEQTVDDFVKQDKFFAYYITLSGHGSYDSSNFVAEKHISKLNGYSYPSPLKYYLAAHIDFDIAMEKLLTSLKENNKLDDTLIVISSDHSPYYLSNGQVNMLSSIDRTNNFDRNRGSLIIYNGKLKGEYSTDKYAMNIDVLPTVLNMLDIPFDSRIIIGKDIMAKNKDGLVIFPDHSWVNNNGSYDASTSKFTPYVDGIDEKYINKVTQEVNDKFQISVDMQYNDYYKYIFK